MAELIMLRGLPGSGKSTWAKEYIESKPPGSVVRVNKDDLRAMMSNGKYVKSLERLVISVRDALVVAALQNKVDVVVDDTNFNTFHAERLRHLAEWAGAGFRIKDFHTPITECIARDALRPKPVGEGVIRNMAKQYGV